MALPTLGRVVLVSRNDVPPPGGEPMGWWPAIVQRVREGGSLHVCVLDDTHEIAAPYNRRDVVHVDVAQAEGSTHRGFFWKWPPRA